MTDKQRLELRQSVIRSRLAEIAGLESTVEIRAEIDTLGTEYGTNETTLRAYTIAADAEPVEVRSNEDRQRAELLKQANVGQLVFDLLNGRATSGQMAEYQREYGLADNEISVRMLADDEIETRAVTPAPGNVGQSQQPIVPFVFPSSVGAFMGVDMPVVGVGDAVFPVLTSQLTVGTPAENALQAETTGAFSADVLSPARLQASFFYSREDRARFAGMDAALRETLSMGLADGLDRQIVRGTNGLLTGTNLADHDASAITDYADYVNDFAYARVDGMYADSAAALRIVMGTASYAHAGSVYRGATADYPALDRLMALTGGVRVSAHVPAASGDKQNAIIRRGMRRDCVAAVWENVAFIPDEITKAGEGQIVITAVMLHAVKILRTAGFYKAQTQHA